MSLYDVLLRVFCALVSGMIVGLERKSHGRPAGMRTSILVCTSACLAMLASEEMAYYFGMARHTESMHVDPSRMAQGVLTGMGFLGAGNILRQANTIRGVTTAALMWFLTILGLAFGVGLFVIGAAGLAIATLVLFILPCAERLVGEDWYACVTIRTDPSGPDQQLLEQTVRKSGGCIELTGLSYDIAASERTVRIHLRIRREHIDNFTRTAIQHITQLSGVRHVEWDPQHS